MNPEKLFDYLEGNLPEADRLKLEKELSTNTQLQRELAIAREMHTRMRGSREVLGASDELKIPSERDGILGRRVATAFAVLVFVNVLVGIAFIVGKNPKKIPADIQAKESAMHQQLTSSLSQAAENTLPLPTLDGSEIRLSAPAPEREAMANNVVLFAAQCGGSGTKAPPDETGITVLVDIPAEREDEFRGCLAPLDPAQSPSQGPTKERPANPAKRKIIYVRISEPGRSTS